MKRKIERDAKKNEQLIQRTGTLRVSEKSCSACHPRYLSISRHGQQILEYAILIAALSAALLTMYVYAKRGLQSTIKICTDEAIGFQNESQPIISNPQENQGGLSLMSSSVNETFRTRKSEAGVMYDFDSVTTSTGVSTMDYQQQE